MSALLEACEVFGVLAVEADPHGQTGTGCLELADTVSEVVESGQADYRPLYPDDMGLREKIGVIATEIYGADGVDFLDEAARAIDRLESFGMRSAPVCIAKTQYSFSDNPSLLARPTGFKITVRDVTPSAGAGFVVAKTVNIMTMPGLSARPAAVGMSIKDNGEIVGLA